MKKETQTIEFKQSWQDEYLQWICGYANAWGGTLYLGKDDNGKTVGLTKTKSLMESIPCKITDTMGIVADVNLCEEGGLEYIQIVVEKYPSLISYHGKYYYRSGSTMRTITGKELDRLILRQHGKTWDAVPLPKIRSSNLAPEAIAYFKQEAVRRGRLSRREVDVSRDVLLDNLHLVDDEGYLVRAAMMAFHADPEKWITGAYVKIGCFGKSDADLLYQDEVHGPILMQADKVVDLVYTKYLKALITYEGIHRVEQFMFNRDAFREIVLNAIVHKDYASCNPIQISVYPNKIYIWNDGMFPEGLDTAAKLYRKHSSKPFNPNLATVFFKCGLIEAWGRGFDKIVEGCREYKGPRPAYKISSNGVMVLCKACPAYEKLREERDRNLPYNAGLRTRTANPTTASSGDTASGTVTETVIDTITKTITKEAVPLTKEQWTILQIIRDNPAVSAEEIGTKLGLTRAGAIYHINKLKTITRIRRVGTPRNGHWEIM